MQLQSCESSGTTHFTSFTLFALHMTGMMYASVRNTTAMSVYEVWEWKKKEEIMWHDM